MTVSETEARERIAAARAGCAAAGFDALVVTPGSELRYLTGYPAMSLERLTALVVPARGEAFLVVPRLEAAAARAAGVDGVVPIVDFADGEDAYALVARRLGTGARVLAASDRLPALQWFEFCRAVPGVELALASRVLSPMRMVKSDFEVGELARAAAAIDRVHERVPGWLRPGRTEAEVAADIAAAIVEEGHASVEFVIVGSGPNAASPHAVVTDRVLGDGDVVVVDIGGVVDSGYGSDCTRTYCLGEPPAEFSAYYGVLREAQAAAVAAVRPGVTAEAVDAAARDVLAAAGYGENFIHRTGHGIGLDGHEEPYIVAGNATVLEPGMAFSIEPGVYMSGRHGARIEDIVVCTTDGVRRLNTLDTAVVRV